MIKHWSKQYKIIKSNNNFYTPSKYIYSNVSENLKIYKAYKLQFDTLGYIACSNNIHDRTLLSGKVNKQINKHDNKYIKHKNSDNAFSLVCKILKTKQIHSEVVYDKFDKVIQETKINYLYDNVSIVNDPYIVIIRRLINKLRKKGYTIQLDENTKKIKII